MARRPEMQSLIDVIREARLIVVDFAGKKAVLSADIQELLAVGLETLKERNDTHH